MARHEIRLVRSCICKLPADCLVTSSNRRLEGKASKAYWRHAGRVNVDGEVRRLGDTKGVLTAACQRVLKAGILTDWEVVAVATACHEATELRRLTGARRIVHAMSPDAYSDGGSKREDYRKLVSECLSLASSGVCHDSSSSNSSSSSSSSSSSRRGSRRNIRTSDETRFDASVRSISMPALGCGVKGWTAAVAAECAVEGIVDHLQERKAGDPKLSIAIALWGDATARAWSLVFANCFSSEMSAMPVEVKIDLNSLS